MKKRAKRDKAKKRARPVKAKSKPEPNDGEETPESIRRMEALGVMDDFYGHSDWTWEQYDRDYYARSTLGQLQSIVRDALGLKYDLDLQTMTPDQVRQALGSLKTQRSQEEHATRRQAWMDERHPGWSLLDWRTHTGSGGLAYGTLKKYRVGITSNQTRRVRAALAKAENVPINTVPE